MKLRQDDGTYAEVENIATFRSPCCKAPVAIEGRRVKWHVCTHCGEPLDESDKLACEENE